MEQGIPVGGSVMWYGDILGIPMPPNFLPNDGLDFTMELRSPLRDKATDDNNITGYPYKCVTQIIEGSGTHSVTIDYSDLPPIEMPSDDVVNSNLVRVEHLNQCISVNHNMGTTKINVNLSNTRTQTFSSTSSPSYSSAMAFNSSYLPKQMTRSQMNSDETSDDRFAPSINDRSQSWTTSGEMKNEKHKHSVSNPHWHRISQIGMSAELKNKDDEVKFGSLSQKDIEYTLRPKRTKARMITRIW